MKNKTPRIIVGVLGLPVRINGKGWEFFLTQRFSSKHSDVHLKWQLSGGGMEFGETPEQTLTREFREELNLVPQILHPQPIVITVTWEKNGSGFGQGAHVVLLAYIISIGSQTPQNVDPDHETGEMGWYSAEDIETLECLPNTKSIIKQALCILDNLPSGLL